MEGWFPWQDGERTCLRVAEAAESHVSRGDRSRRRPHHGPVLVVPEPETTPQRRTLLSAGGDAGGQTINEPAMREVCLDLPLHGRPNKRHLTSDTGVFCKLRAASWGPRRGSEELLGPEGGTFGFPAGCRGCEVVGRHLAATEEEP